MQIQTKQNTYTPQFKALHIAKAGDLNLYKLTSPADKRFAETLIERVKIDELMPSMPKDATERWHEMLRYAIDNAQDFENATYLETFKNKPCGIITFRPGAKTVLDCICTFPTEIGKKVKLAGKTLFLQMFKDIQKERGKKVELEAITNGPFDVVTLYESLGFKKTSEVYPTKIVMEMGQQKIKEALSILQRLIDYTPIEPTNVNLFRTLD